MLDDAGRGRQTNSERLRSLLGTALLILLVCTPTVDARSLDAGVTVTRGWAGYVVRTGAGSFTAVSGRWVQPRVVCNRPGSTAAFWVGLGGATRSSEALEQIGTSADCSDRAVLAHSAWYQLFPAPPVELQLAVRPGDTISAHVAVSGRTVSLALHNVTSGEAFSTELYMSSPETDSAEWIVEAPSLCLRTCEPLPLAAFKRVAFVGASAASGGHVGKIRDRAWALHRFKMASAGGNTTAAPTSLAGNGSSFAVIPSAR